jgi:hypothetical protein
LARAPSSGTSVSARAALFDIEYFIEIEANRSWAESPARNPARARPLEHGVRRNAEKLGEHFGLDEFGSVAQVAKGFGATFGAFVSHAPRYRAPLPG